MISSKFELKYFLSEDFKRYEHRLKRSNSLVDRFFNFMYRHTDSVLQFQRHLRFIEYYDYKIHEVKNKSKNYSILYYTILYYTILYSLH